MAYRTLDEFIAVKALIAAGSSDRTAASETGVPVGTVRRWRQREVPPAGATRAAELNDWNVIDGPAYCYLLGVYLGDGTLSHQRPGYGDLRIVNDRRYPGISAEILSAMSRTFPTGSVRRRSFVA
jgi:hypothetical protein